MTDNITLPRAVAEMMFNALLDRIHGRYAATQEDEIALAALDAALAEPPVKPYTLAELFAQFDAERYRWLRGEVQGPHTPLAQVVWKRNNIRESGDWTNLSDGQSLDEAIDAALAERGENGKTA